MRGELHVELDVFLSVKQCCSSQEFKQKAPKAPHIAQRVRSLSLPPVVLICLLPGIDRKKKHLRRLDGISASILVTVSVSFSCVHVAFPKVSDCYRKVLTVELGLAKAIVGLFRFLAVVVV